MAKPGSATAGTTSRTRYSALTERGQATRSEAERRPKGERLRDGESDVENHLLSSSLHCRTHMRRIRCPRRVTQCDEPCEHMSTALLRSAIISDRLPSTTSAEMNLNRTNPVVRLYLARWRVGPSQYIFFITGQQPMNRFRLFRACVRVCACACEEACAARRRG